jgi:RNA polymerase sigma-70 factor (ECF subfamily)
VEPEQELREFERFFERTSGALVGQAYVLVGNLQDAQDLVQEAFARAWDRWPVVSGFEDPAGWTRRVLFNLAMSRLRRRRLEQRHAPEPAAPASAPSADAVDLARALRRLPASQRRAIVLREVVGLDMREVAREMRTSEGTVRKWLHRARTALAADMSADEGFRRPSSTLRTATEVRHV